VKILITGGGTGGHVAPAMAVVGALRAIDPDIVLRYVGSAAGIESKMAAEANVEFVSVATGKLRRASNPLKMVSKANIIDAFRVPLGVVQAFRAVRTFRPDAVLATGGYVCVPTVLAAAMQRTPVLTHEQTVTVGLANRIAGRFAKQIALTFEESKQHLSSKLAAKALVTGNPLRPEIFAGTRAASIERFGFATADEHLPCIYVTGGAQGARVINTAVSSAATQLLANARVLHQCGRNDLEALRKHHEELPPELAARWQIRAFIELSEIGDAWAGADLLVARAGAGTVTEASALGKPAVYIPLEPTSGDEQLKNAQRYERSGGAVVLRQADCNASTLAAAIVPLLSDRARRQQMGVANAGLATPNAAATLANLLRVLATKP
jgi:UDP-N-acetylglucosamine--N-acetylmuramyl-(pentapeptide) pyrophosphoryl-undecaprenol N-acetylglucosamine transferase